MRSLGIDYHLYADDTQLYITFKSADPNKLIAAKLKVKECVRKIDMWLIQNKQKLNSDKTEIMMLSARHRPCPLFPSITVCDKAVDLSQKVRNIGVIMDSHLPREMHVTTVCKSGFYYLRKISKIRKYLSSESAKTIVHALVTSRLDFGNSLLYGLPNTLLERIQRVQNAAARIVTLSNK